MTGGGGGTGAGTLFAAWESAPLPGALFEGATVALDEGAGDGSGGAAVVEVCGVASVDGPAGVLLQELAIKLINRIPAHTRDPRFTVFS